MLRLIPSDHQRSIVAHVNGECFSRNDIIDHSLVELLELHVACLVPFLMIVADQQGPSSSTKARPKRGLQAGCIV